LKRLQEHTYSTCNIDQLDATVKQKVCTMTIKLSILKTQFPHASELVYGCMGLGGDWNDTKLTAQDIRLAEQAVDAATNIGINFFDLADIYRQGKSEEAFGQLLQNKQLQREDIVVQSKCGIRLSKTGTNHYDFSDEWINRSVDGIFKRLQTDYLDILMLHRPDILVDAEALNETLKNIYTSGKVKAFAVSNMNVSQLSFLQKTLEVPIIANQIELSLSAAAPYAYAIQANQSLTGCDSFYSGLFEYAQLNGVELQSWGSLANGKYSSEISNNDSEQVRATKQLVCELAEHYGVSKEAILLSFIRRHPASIRPVIGSTNTNRILACKDAHQFELSKEHWYSLLCASMGQGVP